MHPLQQLQGFRPMESTHPHMCPKKILDVTLAPLRLTVDAGNLTPPYRPTPQQKNILGILRRARIPPPSVGRIFTRDSNINNWPEGPQLASQVSPLCAYNPSFILERKPFHPLATFICDYFWKLRTNPLPDMLRIPRIVSISCYTFCSI